VFITTLEGEHWRVHCQIRSERPSHKGCFIAEVTQWDVC